MNLALTTKSIDSLATQGELDIDRVFECYTLELPYVDGSVGSAIPEGTFPVVLQPSPKFMRSFDPWVKQFAEQMPHIIDIPGRSLIMFHWGNFAGDLPGTPEIEHSNTEGCILVGRSEGEDFLRESRIAFESFFGKIRSPAASGNCFLTVTR